LNSAPTSVCRPSLLSQGTRMRARDSPPDRVVCAANRIKLVRLGGKLMLKCCADVEKCCADLRRGGAPLGIKWCISHTSGAQHTCTVGLLAASLCSCCMDRCHSGGLHLLTMPGVCVPYQFWPGRLHSNGPCCCLLAIVPAVAAILQGCLACVVLSAPLWEGRLCSRAVLHACMPHPGESTCG